MKFKGIALLLLPAVIFSFSCDRKSSVSPGNNTRKQQEEKLISLALVKKEGRYVTGDTISFTLTRPDTLVIDSVAVYLRGQEEGVYPWQEKYSISTDSQNPGKAGVRVKVFYHGKSNSVSKQVEILSDIVPKRYTYKVVNTFPHDVEAYTQGLQYYDGWFYEGTGNYNQSTVRKVRVENGEVIQIRNNASDIFGEGITIYKGRIYQLTYKAQICYVYDLNTFDEVQKYYFQAREGWGLTTAGDELVMSDGTNILYFLDPEMFTVKRQMEVYNNNGPVLDLNELEYIDGKIFANRYYSDEIAIINPVTGKEEGIIDLKGILSVKDRKPSTNVLNGIAWDENGRRLFVTGKYWPKLFEIKVVPVGEQ